MLRHAVSRSLLAALAFLILTLLPTASFARQDPAPPTRESFAGSLAVTVVEVPVQVIDEGRSVAGLTAENFEIYDGGKRREILSFEVIDFAASVPTTNAPEPAVAPPPSSPSARRNLLLLFDFTFANSGLLERARQGALTMVRSQLGPRDRAAVAVYGNGSGAQLLTGFTTDRKALELALDVVGAALDRKGKREQKAWEALQNHLYGPADHRPSRLATLASTVGSAGALALAGPLLPPSVDESALVVGLEGSDGRAGAGGGGAVTAGDGPSEGALGTIIANDPSELAQQSAAQIEVDAVRSLAEGLGELATLLTPVQGQNHLLYFSQGFSARYLEGDAGVQSATSSLEAMYADFRRAGWSIHAVDVTGLRPGGGSGGDIGGYVGGPGIPGGPPGSGFAADALLVMAEATGGELYENYNRMAEATAQALERTRVTYLLTFSPDDIAADGTYHPLDVKVKGAPLGSRVVHRPGYHAPKPAGERTRLEKRLAEAEEILGTRQVADFPVAVLAAPFGTRGDGGFTRVPVLLEVPGETLIPGGAAEGELRLRVQAYAVDDAGSILDFLAQDLSFDLARVGERLRGQGVRVYGELALPPGVYRLRLQVEDATTTHRHLVTVPVVVGGTDETAELLPPLFPDLDSGWVLARASREGEARASYPFTLAGREIVPDLRPTLAAGEARALVLLTRSAPGGQVALESRVRTADGKVVPGGRLELRQRVPAEEDGFERLVATFTPEGLAPGEYRLEVTLANRATGQRTTRQASFTVRETTDS